MDRKIARWDNRERWTDGKTKSLKERKKGS
jgi:hypothetical protein